MKLISIYGVTVMKEELYPEIELVEDKIKRLNLFLSQTDLMCYYDSREEQFFIGAPLSQIRDDETGRFFKERTKGLINEILGECFDFGVIEEIIDE
jgi:hypothetical protein